MERPSLNGHDAGRGGIERECSVGAGAVRIAICVIEPVVEAEAVEVTVHADGWSNERGLEFVVIANLHVVCPDDEPARGVLRRWRPCTGTITEFPQDASWCTGRLRDAVLENSTVNEWRHLSCGHREAQGELDVAVVRFAWRIGFVEHAGVGEAVWQHEHSSAHGSCVRRDHIHPSHCAAICGNSATGDLRRAVQGTSRDIGSNGYGRTKSKVGAHNDHRGKTRRRQTVIRRNRRNGQVHEIVGNTRCRSWIAVEIVAIVIRIRAVAITRQTRVRRGV